MTTRFAACLLAVTLLGAVVTASIRVDAVSPESAVSPDTTAASAIDGIDISALNATAGSAYLPLLTVHDPI